MGDKSRRAWCRENPNPTAVGVGPERAGVWGFLQLQCKHVFLNYSMLVATRIDQSQIREDSALKREWLCALGSPLAGEFPAPTGR
jgi:hypothetical protein